MSVEQEVIVEVKPGYDSDQVLTFKGKGHQEFHHNPSDLIIKFGLCQNESSENFVRKGNDLIYTHTIDLKDALCHTPLHIFTLDNRCLNLSLDHYITPQTVHCLEGEGMPVKLTKEDRDEEHLKHVSDRKKGNLYIRFNITFPCTLNND